MNVTKVIEGRLVDIQIETWRLLEVLDTIRERNKLMCYLYKMKRRLGKRMRKIALMHCFIKKHKV